MTARLKIYAGVLVGCRNEKLLKYPADKAAAEVLKEEIRNLVESSGFGVVAVHVDDYGPESGPGITVVLKESHLLIGAWPENNNTVDFLVYFCERGTRNGGKARKVAKLLFEYSKAEKVRISPLTEEGPRLLQKI